MDKYKVYLLEYIKNTYIGPIYGFYIKDTKVFNILSTKKINKYPLLGYFIEDKKEIKNKHYLYVLLNNDKLEFYFRNKKIDTFIESVSIRNKLFSRNSGILEYNLMNKKRAILVGCGSVGSYIAEELVRSGINNLLLVDRDIFNYHNISRHVLDITDVGQYKTIALKEKLLKINPKISISTYNTYIEDISFDVLNSFIKEKDTVLVVTADNRLAAKYSNMLCNSFNIPLIATGFWERAFAGEVFYHIPKVDVCYECTFKEVLKNIDSRKIINENHKYYLDSEEVREDLFEPGISIDIKFIANIALKVIIDLLFYYDKDYKMKYLDYLTQYTLICNYTNITLKDHTNEIFSHPLQITHSIKPIKDKNCSYCKLLK